MQQMTTLGLNNTNITDTGLAYLSTMPEITALYLNNNQISSAGVAIISKMQGITILPAFRTKI
jgi:Leucine-rich repeat (LRR) protein